MTRTTAQDYAYRVGGRRASNTSRRTFANVRLAYKLNWTRREQYDDQLLIECERGWHAADELMNPASDYE